MNYYPKIAKVGLMVGVLLTVTVYAFAQQEGSSAVIVGPRPVAVGGGPAVPQVVTMPGVQPQQVTPSQMEAAQQRLTPEQQSAVAAELAKTGG